METIGIEDSEVNLCSLSHLTVNKVPNKHGARKTGYPYVEKSETRSVVLTLHKTINNTKGIIPLM